MSIRDYLYIDLPKLISLHGQISGTAGGSIATAAVSADDFAKAHPSHLLELETALATQGYLLDLAQGSGSRSLRAPNLRNALANTLCVKVTGRAVIEDYQRIRRSMDALPDGVAFVNKSVQAIVRGTDDFRQLEMTIAAEAEQLKEDTDRTSRAASQGRLLQMRSDLDEAINAATTVSGVEQWALDGLKTWIDSYLPGIINLRVYPSSEFPDEQVIGNLKRECFQEQNLASLQFAHGASPSLPITLVGIVTSVPTEDADTFNPLAEFDRETLSNLQTLEKSNREVLKSVEALENLTRTCNFPRVMVQPLMVYRSVAPRPSATVG